MRVLAPVCLGAQHEKTTLDPSPRTYRRCRMGSSLYLVLLEYEAMSDYDDDKDYDRLMADDGPDDAEPGICPACSGSGEGMHEGTTCGTCKGEGEC